MYIDLEMKHKYIAIASNDCSIEIFPSIMKWSDGIFIAILSELDLYFEKNFPQQNTENALKSYLSGFIDTNTPIVYGTSLAQVILANYSMLEKNMSGIINIDNKISLRILQESSWDSYWRFCNEYEAHRFQLLKKTDKKYVFHREKLKAICSTMSWKKPWDLDSMDNYSIQKRYGKIIADVFSLLKKEDKSIYFPWLNEKEKESFIIARHLNFVSNNWNDFEGLLKEDLCKICFLENFNIDLRIIKMEWELILCDLSSEVLQIPFRHPHNLFKEIPEQKTALLQINNIYNDYLRKLKTLEDYLQYGVIGWNLKVIRTHKAENYQSSLFNDESYEESEIKELENKCLVEFRKMTLNTSPFIEESSPKNNQYKQQVKSIYKKRPLYKLKSIERLDFKDVESYCFLERVSHLSWNTNDSDFYQLKTKSNKSLWAKVNDEGWEIHGCY